jgi:Tol biopolymer transport system component
MPFGTWVKVTNLLNGKMVIVKIIDRLHHRNRRLIDLSNAAERENRETKLISSTFQDDSPDYSPDGKRIAFVSDRTGGKEIWLSESDGANPIQLTDLGGPHTGTPRWSPDGRQIVFDSNVEGNQEILIVSADGGRPRRLTTDPALDMIPSWSRDGRWVYFTSKRSGDFQIWKVSSEGGEARQVTRRGGLEGFESSDGMFLYYSKGIGVSDIWRVAVEGGEEISVLELQKTGHGRAWAVADEGIYFAVAETPSHSAVEFFSFTTGRVERQVAKLERSTKDGPPSLTISRDGRRLLYTRVDQIGSDIMLMEKFR